MVLRSSAVWISRCADYGIRADLSRMYILKYIKAQYMPMAKQKNWAHTLEAPEDAPMCDRSRDGSTKLSMYLLSNAVYY